MTSKFDNINFKLEFNVLDHKLKSVNNLIANSEYVAKSRRLVEKPKFKDFHLNYSTIDYTYEGKGASLRFGSNYDILFSL